MYETPENGIEIPEHVKARAVAAAEMQQERDVRFGKRDAVQSFGKELHCYIHQLVAYFTHFAPRPYEFHRKPYKIWQVMSIYCIRNYFLAPLREMTGEITTIEGLLAVLPVQVRHCYKLALGQYDRRLKEFGFVR